VLNKQHLVGEGRSPASVSRRALLVGAVGIALLQRGSREAQATAACRPSPATGLQFVSGARSEPIPNTDGYRQLKDPCVVSDGQTWHLYGTGWTVGDSAAVIFHAQSDSATGPFTMNAPCSLQGVFGGGVGAPGVIVEDGVFHMFIQTEFKRRHGTLEHLVSTDGDSFVWADTALTADLSLGEAVIYDAQPCTIGGIRYVAYAAGTHVGQTELHLARSEGSWSGPWMRLGPILRQSDIVFQNRFGCAGYEWGLEGPQLVELPTGQVLLFGVCFLAGPKNGHRQRVFAARAPGPMGPYEVLGTPFDPRTDSWAQGENGHPGAILTGDSVAVFYQGRDGAGKRWKVGTTTMQLTSFLP
jgi:hypothetical protein